MTVEPLVISAIVEEGNLRRAYQEGITADDFQVYGEEFEWIEERLQKRLPVNSRTFREKFSDFEWALTKERLPDLLTELKGERAYTALQALFESVEEDLEPWNAIQSAGFVAEMAQAIVNSVQEPSLVGMTSDWKIHSRHMQTLRKLREQGVLPGIPTGIDSLDENFDGIVRGRLYTVLGRPGDAKSFFVTKLAWEAMRHRFRVGLFSPEMNPFEHICRLHTLASADPEVQEACGLKQAFRNRDLMNGRGFNIKLYNNFMEHLEAMEGEITLFTQKYLREQMSVGYIDSRIDTLGLDLVIIDPIYELKAPRRNKDDKWKEITDIVSAVNFLGESHDIPVIITNWAHRQRSKKEAADAPDQDKSFGSDAPSQKADHVIGLRHESERNRLHLRCSKSRFGGNFRAILDFRPNIGIMRELQPTDGEEEEEQEHEDKDWNVSRVSARLGPEG